MSAIAPDTKLQPGPKALNWESRWILVLAVVMMAGAILAAYSNSFQAPYHLDDGDSIEKNASIKSFSTAFFPPRNSGITVSGRPLLNVSLAINYRLGGTEVIGYHIGNLLIHFAAALALFGVVHRTLQQPALAGRFGRHAMPLAWGTATLWALHPMQTESVTYIIQRAESLVGLCYLAALYAFIRALEKPSRTWSAITVIACVLGMTAKEVMATAPLVMFLYDRTFVSGNFAASWQLRRKFYLSLAATWGVLLTLVISSGGRGATVGFAQVSALDYLLTQASGICGYLWRAIVPVNLIFDYGAVVEKDPSVLVPSVIVMLVIMAAIGWALAKKPVLGFLGTWVFLVLGPTSSIIPVATQTLAEHRMYVPLASIMAALVILPYRWNPRFCLGLSIALVSIAGVLSHQRNAVYRTDVSLWQDTVNRVPDSSRARTNLACAYLAANEVSKAVEQFSLAVELMPEASGYTNLGIALAQLGELKEGLVVLAKAVRLKPDNAQFRAIYGNGLLLAKRTDEGIAALQKAVELEPKNASFHFDLANTLSQLDRNEEAERHFKEVLKLAPKDAEALTNYGALLRRMHRLPEALEKLEAAYAIKPESSPVRSNLGVALLESGRADEGVTHLQKAISLDPKNEQARYHLAIYFAETGRTVEAITLFESLINLSPPTAELLSNLAVLYARENRLAEAVTTLKKALVIDPKHSASRENLEKITAYLEQHPGS